MDAAAYREEIYDIFTGIGGDVETQVADALDVGTDYLGLSVGFLSRIDDGTQTIVQATGDHELIQAGESCPLEAAYCRRTVQLDGPLAIQNGSTSSAVTDTAYQTFELGTYVGVRVVVHDEVYGTVCFADEAEREAPFSESEKVFVELLARLSGQAIERREYERELRQRNAQLEREKARFQRIAETSFDVIFRIGPEAQFTFVSDAVERVLGYDPDDLVGAPFTDYVDEASVEEVTSAYARVFEGDAVERLELAFRDVAGDQVILEVNATPVTDGDEVVGIQGVGRDVTARKERERELRIKDRAMDDADIGIVIADAERQNNPIIYANEGFSRLTGYDVEAVVGRNLRLLQGNATDGDTVETLREQIDAGEPVDVEVLNVRADGAPFWNYVQIAPVRDETGAVTHFLGFQFDVTDRKRTDQLIRLLNRVLRHNLRNDMNAIIGFSELIQEAGDDEAAAHARRIQENAATLVDLSEQARALERQANRERDPHRLDLGAVLDDVVDAARDRFPGATLELRVETDREACVGPEIEQAVTELVENALEHNPGGTPWASLEAVDDGDWIELTVADDGPGIDEMEAAVVSKGRETALEHGSGLGLWLVNWIVTRYGGSFQIEATGEEGSVATLRLPAIGPDEAVTAAARPPTVLFR
jgi:PAS domain S-box-containing protein